MEILIIDKKEVDKSKQQLVEKDKEIERLNHKINVEEPCLIRNYKDMIEQLKQSLKDHERELVMQVCEKIKNIVNKKLEEIGDCDGELYAQYTCKGQFEKILSQLQKEFEK